MTFNFKNFIDFINLSEAIMNLTQLFNPIRNIVGLEITSRQINAVLLKKNKKGELELVRKFAPVPAGVVQNGEIKKPAELAQAIKSFWQANKDAFQSKFAIFALPSSSAFCDVLKLPQISNEQTAEAVKLNLSTKTLFPMEPQDVYYDWQPLKSKDIYHHYEMVGLALRGKIKQWIDVCSNAGIEPLAFESSAFSASRAIGNFEHNTGLFIRVADDGIDLSVIAENEIRFSRFVPMPEKVESFDRFKEFVKMEAQKVINFYTTDDPHNEEIKKIVIAFNFAKKNELEEYLTKNLGISAEHIKFSASIKEAVGNLADDESVLPVLGAAMRGLIKREEDTLISLMPIGTEENYQHTRLLAYVSLWSDIINATAILLALLFVGTWLFLNVIGKRLDQQLAQFQAAFTSQSEIPELEEQARRFNDLTVQISALGAQNNWIEQLEKVTKILGQPNIKIHNINMPDPAGIISANVSASDRNAAIAFRKNMEKNEELESALIPLLPLELKENINMNISFKLKEQIKE